MDIILFYNVYISDYNTGIPVFRLLNTKDRYFVLFYNTDILVLLVVKYRYFGIY